MIKIGFPLGLYKAGGPNIFLKRLKNSYKKNNLFKTSFFFDPTANLLIFNAKVRNLWNKPHIMRLDGISHGSHLSRQEIEIRNTPVIEGIKNAKGLIYQSEFSKFIINNFYSINPNIPNTIINNGVDLEEFNPKGYNLREKLGIKPSDLVFITSASWRPLKRLDYIINSFIDYKRIVNKKIYLIILGQLNKKYNDLPKEIVFAGKIKHNLLPDWYRTADIYLFYSLLENCSNTVLEALATRLPVLCTNLAGTKELIKLTNGGIVVEADKKLDLEKFNFLEPPPPDQKKILEGINTIVKYKNKISDNINTKLIDINFIAQKYHDFIKKLEL